MEFTLGFWSFVLYVKLRSAPLVAAFSRRDGFCGIVIPLMLEDLERNVPTLSEDARYWYVRTDGGTLYEAFRATGTIAFGYEQISLDFVKSLGQVEESREKLKDEIKKYHPPKKREDGRSSDISGLAASQIWRFCKEMRGGDIVVVPSERSERLAIGILTDDPPFEEPLKLGKEVFPGFSKRRSVNWIRGVDKADINPNLFQLFTNPQAIVEASDYSQWIDPLLYEFFRKGDQFHYVLHVGAQHVRATALFRTCLELFDLAEDFAREEEIESDFDGIETRINLNSPGSVELWVGGIATLAVVAMIVVALAGGGYDYVVGQKLKLKTDGLLDKLTHFLNERQRRKIVEDARVKLQGMNIKKPEQLIEILKLLKK